MISDEGFPKKERLVKTKDFRKAYKEGSFFKKDGFVVYVRPNDLAVNRIGFSIPSRKVKLATRRNRIRRVLRESYRKNKKFLKKGFDMAMVLKKDPGEEFTYKKAENIFLALAKEARISE